MKRWLIALPLAALLAACSVQSQGTVPLRAKAEAMGARVDWNEAESSVILRYEGSAVRLYPASGTMLVDGRRHSLGAPLEVRKGRTMISPAAWTQVSDALKRGGKAITGFKQVAQFAVPGQRAEIVAATPDGSRVVVTQADLGRIAVVNVRDLANIRLEATIPFQDMVVTGEVTSAAITPDGRYALVVVRAGDNLVRAYPGSLYVVDLATRRVAGGHLLGIGPDAIAISRDGTVAVIANEDEEQDPVTGEVDMQYTRRPGSVSIVTMPGGDASQATVTTLPLSLVGVPGAVYPHDPQPEYAAISPDGRLAAVTLQENNAIALIDLAARQVMRTFSLGTTRHAADLKKDDMVAFTETLTARPEPDAIAFTPDGKYLITANEGDLGRNQFGDGIHSGGRNFMVWDLNGTVIYDSGLRLDKEAHEAGLYPDSRSDARGTEPEHVLVTTHGRQHILAVAAERADALFFFDITDIHKPVPLGHAPAGTGPESTTRIPDTDLLVTADEVSGTLTFFAPVR